jgi:energy-coupling factor transporter ATP-binding protein EcfA2
VRLEQVTISRLRGIPGDWPTLKIAEKGLIVYGPNGVGKSSIIDALEATIRGTSSLFAQPRAGVNWDTASPHVKGGGPPSCVVRGVYQGKLHEVTLGQPAAPDLAGWLEAASASSFVLRRYMLLKFVDAEPRARYEQVEPFLNLASFSELERGLETTVAELTTRLADANSRVATNSQIIRQTFGLQRDQAIDHAGLVRVLKEQLILAGLHFSENEYSDLDKLAIVLANELSGETSNKRIGALGAAKQRAQQLTSASILRSLYEQVLAAAAELDAAISSAAQKVPLDLLVNARDHLGSSAAAEMCPVCEQNIDPVAIIARLDDRIRENEAVGRATVTFNQRLEALRKAASNAHVAYVSFMDDWSQLALPPLPPRYAEAAKLFELLEALPPDAAKINSEELKANFARSECDPSAQIAVIDEAIASVGGGGRRASLNDAAGYISSLRISEPTYQNAVREASVISNQRRFAEKLRAHAETARKCAVQQIADRVADLANEYYDFVHPGEGIATATLIVRQSTSASMLLNATFHGFEAPPLKYYSEGHLDTLGLCFFLAIRKLEIASSPIFKLLLIDDVLHSVDAEHRTRLAALLKNNFADHQLVLVTHDKNFYDRLKVTLGTGYHYTALSSWDIDLGPRLSDPSTDLDRVIDKALRKIKSHDEIAAAAGRFFEWLLKSLTERLQVAIPARFTYDHDIGSMWPGLAAKLGKHKAFAAAHLGLVKQLSDLSWVRNKIGAHDSGGAASPVTPEEVTEFADVVAVLYKATTCADCATTIQSSKENRDVWRCGCSKLQYDP